MTKYDRLSVVKKILLVLERSIVPVSAAFDLCVKVKNNLTRAKTTCTECEATLWEGDKPVNWMRKVTDHLTICRKTNLGTKAGHEGRNAS
jgi:hypothetical protein